MERRRGKEGHDRPWSGDSEPAGGAVLRAPRRTRCPLGVGRDVMANASHRPREEQIGEHDYARVSRLTWLGEVIIGDGDDACVIRGTWNLEWPPRGHMRAVASAAVMPEVRDAVAWTTRAARLMTLAEPGLQLRIGASDADGWTTLEVTAPSHPATVLELDRHAMATVAGVPAIALRVFA